ncbi:hypothetical protein ACJX0J_010881, partial [Zea mays]
MRARAKGGIYVYRFQTRRVISIENPLLFFQNFNMTNFCSSTCARAWSINNTTSILKYLLDIIFYFST